MTKLYSAVYELQMSPIWQNIEVFEIDGAFATCSVKTFPGSNE